MRTKFGANTIRRNGKIKTNSPPVGINAGKGERYERKKTGGKTRSEPYDYLQYGEEDRQTSN